MTTDVLTSLTHANERQRSAACRQSVGGKAFPLQVCWKTAGHLSPCSFDEVPVAVPFEAAAEALFNKTAPRVTSAATDLLIACQLLLIDGDVVWNLKARELAEAAIAKATGAIEETL